MACSVLCQETDINLLIVGPPGTGKKSFIRALTNYNIEIPDCGDDIFPVYNLVFDVYGKNYSVTVWCVQDVQVSVDRIIEICQNPNSCSLILFWYAVNIPQSLTILSRNYITYMRQNMRFPFLTLLVGSKMDLRLEGGHQCLQFEHGVAVKTSFHLGGFLECSTKIEKTVKDVFMKAVYIALGIEDDLYFNPK